MLFSSPNSESSESLEVVRNNIPDVAINKSLQNAGLDMAIPLITTAAALA